MSGSTIFAAVGDSFITRRLPSLEDKCFYDISFILKKADVRFTNLETTIHNGEGIPSAVSGGTWAMASPYVLNAIKAYGFNLLSRANNHALDYSYEGLRATEKYLEQLDFVHTGAGENLSKASDPKYFDSKGGRIGFISVTSTFHNCWIAGEQRRDMQGRPGINPLRFQSVYVLPNDKFEHLKTCLKDIDTSLVKEFEIDPGDLMFKFGEYFFAAGEPQSLVSEPDIRDLERIGKSISEAKRLADYVVVSIHSHESEGGDTQKPPNFLVDFARYCIDCGANSVIGHGPHIIRGIEIYKDSPIFYSLGNFIFQNDTVQKLPSDFYEQYGLGPGENTADALDARSRKDTTGFTAHPFVWESVIPVWEMEDKKLKSMTVYPVELGFNMPRYKRGWPDLSDNTEILKRLQKLSQPFGTKIEIEGAHGRLLL